MSIRKFFTSKKTFWIIYSISVSSWLIHILIDYFCSKFSTWDTGAHIQPVIHWALFGEYEDKLLDVAHPFLNHFRPALLIFTPLAKVFPSMLILHIAKLITFSITPLIFLHYAKKHINKNWIYLIPIFYCSHDVIFTSMAAENQATALVIPLIVWAFFLAFEKKYLKMLLALCLIIFFKENLPLIWVSIGLFICIEQKNYKWGLFTLVTGIIIGLTIYFVVIPEIAGGLNHQHEGLMPFKFIGLKLLMLFRVHLSMGLFVLLWPSIFLISLPIYAVYLLGGDTIYRALWLGSHNHDFTTAFLFCMGFYVLKQVLENKTWLNTNSKIHLNLLKTTACLLFIIGITKLPIFNFFSKIDHYKTGYDLRQLAYQAKPTLLKDYTYNVSPRLMEYFIDLRTIASFDNKRYLKIFSSQDPFYIIFPTNRKFYGVHPEVVTSFYEIIKSHHNLKTCALTIYSKNNAQIVVARYDTPLSTNELSKVQKKLNKNL